MDSAWEGKQFLVIAWDGIPFFSCIDELKLGRKKERKKEKGE